MDHCTEELDGPHQHESQHDASQNSEKRTESGLHLTATSD